MSEPRWCVPVKSSGRVLSLRLFRTPAGRRTAVAFSSPLKLAKVLGTDQRWVLLTAPALRDMLAELGVTGIVVDPAGTMSSRAAAVA
ncbi:SseB protein N-terminal domain-containing protein [Nonomuraea maritima]|uniref:SseB protein N-terminal domain-containing protein n=1 Tax=Nonomuraea maritima TaxID=683260 RepID=A0A1G8YYL1_9ACTN|nr:SAV_915 family protein [Nonomuraea maritima]SDK07918.1 SseB protein N-terminal domain-containing protein [Nonomuraea maritima]